MTMKSVGLAANAMVLEIKRQFDNNPNLLIPNHPDRPDYDKCITISTDASLREMVTPIRDRTDLASSRGSLRSSHGSLPLTVRARDPLRLRRELS